MSNLVHFLRRRRLPRSAAPVALLVGACTFPDYTFQQTSGSTGGLGGMGLTVAASSTGSAITSTGGPSSDTGTSDASGTTTTMGAGAGGGSGGSSGNLAGAAGEGAAVGADAGGSAGTAGSGAAAGVEGSGGTGGSGGSSGSGGNTGNGGNASSGGSGGTGGSQLCGNDEQCRSGQCDDGWCRPDHCGNGAADVYETDTDCGGPECRPCGYDQHCFLDTDCGTLDCSSAERCRPTLNISCSCNSMGSCNQTPQATLVDIRFQNTGTEPIALESLRFRYFYSAEGSGSDEVTCDAVNFTGGTCSLFDAEVRATGYEDPTASHEVAFWFSDGVLSPGQETGSIRFSIHSNGPYQRGNDYSFQGVPTGATPAACEHIVAMNVDDVPIWGVLPE